MHVHYLHFSLANVIEQKNQIYPDKNYLKRRIPICCKPFPPHHSNQHTSIDMQMTIKLAYQLVNEPFHHEREKFSPKIQHRICYDFIASR